MPLSFEDLSSIRLLSLPREKTLFVFALGVNEDHGPHLPIGLDSRESAWLSERIGERVEREMEGWTVVRMPPAALSVDSLTTGLAFPVRAHVVRDYLVDVCSGLARNGFRYFLVLPGTLGPRQITAIEDAGRMLRRKHGGSWLRRILRGRSAGTLPALMSAGSAWVSREEVMRSPLWLSPAEHGGERDTGIARVISPDSVDPSSATLPPQERPSSGLEYAWLRARHRVSGYVGEPSKADAAKAAEILKDQIDTVIPKLRAVVLGANPDHVFRSWYSVFPPNRSFFKAWCLALAVGLIMLAWMIVSIQAMIGA